MSDSHLARMIATVLSRTGISYLELAAGAGVSISTSRRFVETGRLPERASARDALERFAERNGNATKRSDLRFA